MADIQGLFRYPGVTQVVRGSYTMTTGVTPGTVQLDIAPQSSITAEGPLNITYGGVLIVLPNCRVLRESMQYDNNGLLISVSLYDRRWKWKNSWIRGSYNLRWPDGSLNTNTERSMPKLMEGCLLNMGETRYDLSLVPPRLRPEVHWDYDNAAQALEHLAGLAGMRVVYRLDDSVAVVPIGVGQAMPPGNLIQQSKSAVPPLLPNNLIFVAGPSRYQIDVLLSPVGIDLDGTIKPIAKLSYANQFNGRWGKTCKAPCFPLLDTVAPGTIARQLAMQSVFRWFQIDPAPLGIDGKPLQVPGYNFDPLNSTIKAGSIVSRQQILPLEDERVEVWKDANEIVIQPDGSPTQVPVPKNKRALLWGFYPILDRSMERNLPFGKTTTLVPGSQVGPQKKGGSGAEFTRGYTIDRAEGIVKLHECCYWVASEADAVGINREYNQALFYGRQYPAQFALRVATSIRDQYGKMPVRYTQIKWLSTPQPNNQSFNSVVLRHEECQASFWPSYSFNDDTVTGVNSTITQSVFPNTPPLQQEAQYYLDAKAAEYQVGTPEEGMYAGILPISLDGALQSIHWEVGPGGSKTHVSRNGELANVTMPYRQRKMLIDMWNLRDIKEVAKTNLRLASKLAQKAFQNG